MVIRCCGNLVPEELPSVRTALVQEIWKTLNNLNVPMDISHYNALLRVYLENEYAFSPTDFLADLESKGIEPNRVTYQRLISRYCQTGDIEGATRILEFMREKQLPVNENVFNALIMGHSQSDDMESASGILNVMTQAGLEPSADSYTTLLCGYARKGEIETIEKLLEECEKKDVFLLDKDLLDIIYALAVNGHSQYVDPITPRIRKSIGYNQDAVNCILRLINKNHEEVAMKVLKTMSRSSKSDGELNDTGNFLIRQLVKAKRPVDKILAICKELESNKLNNRALLVALESAISNGCIDMTVPLLKEAQTKGLEIRQHYFWPLICADKNSESILNVLKLMVNEFKITPNGETIREYVVPNLLLSQNNKDYEKCIGSLRSAGISIANASTSLAYQAILDNDIEKAATIASSFSAYYAPSLFRRPLVAALMKTNDYESYIRFVRQLYDNLSRFDQLNRNQKGDVEEEHHDKDIDLVTSSTGTTTQADVLGQLCYDVLTNFRNDRVEALEKILNGFVAQGLSISAVQAEKIQDKLGSQLTDEISKLLSKLATGDLEPIPLEKNSKTMKLQNEMSVEQLENLIAKVDAKNENSKGLKRQLLNSVIRSKDTAKIGEVFDRLEKENFVISSGVYAQLIDAYCSDNKLNEALATLDKIKIKDPEFILDNIKTIKLIQLQINENKLTDAINFLKTNKASENTDEAVEKSEANSNTAFNYRAVCWRLLNQLAEAGKEEELNQVFNALIEHNYIIPNNVLLGPLVKVHLIKDDINSAVNVFEQISLKYRTTPWKNELACKLIQLEDAANLQKLTDLSTDIHGEVNSLYDLVFSFVECGRIRQARKILETPGLRTRPQRINSACERYRNEGMVTSLEGLMEATKDLNHIDRADIYQNLLLSYIKNQQPEKALNLWTKLQEDDIPPTDEFLIKLSDFLKTNNYDVPFVVPTPAANKIQTKEKIVKKEKSIGKTQENSAIVSPLPNKKMNKNANKIANVAGIAGAAAVTSESVLALKRALKSGEVDQILAAKEKLSPNDKLNLTDQSLLIESLVKAERLTEATKNVLDLLAANAHPIPRIFRFYLNKVAASGDVQTLEKIDKLLKSDIKKLISFDNRYCHANIVAGKVEDYLKQLENNIVNAKTEEEIKEAGEKFPRGGAVGILETFPEMNERYENIAEKYCERGIVSPMNVLWLHYFIMDNQEAAERIWNKYLSSSPRLMFQRIVHLAREKQDDTLIIKLIELLKNTKVSEGAIGNAYSCWLDILTSKEKYDECLVVLDAAIKDVCLEHINRTALMRIKDGIEKSGKDFPYKIPSKQIANTKAQETSSSSSSSSSDDEVTKKKMKQ